MFTWDFCPHFNNIFFRFSETPLESLISEVLSALLICLTDLENHEKELRNYMTNKNNAILENKSVDRTPSNYAEILYRIEHRMARYIGPEEFAQCNNNVLQKQVSWNKIILLWSKLNTVNKIYLYQFNSIPDKSLGFQDSKRTCNLESYIAWCDELRLFICNDILKVTFFFYFWFYFFLLNFGLNCRSIYYLKMDV